MNTRILYITNEQLLAMADVPSDAMVERTGATTGTERGKMDGVYALISSAEFEAEDCDRPIECETFSKGSQ